MTGFARREASGPWGQLTCEVRSVNHRYLEPGFRLPEELRGLEGELRQTLPKLLRRGKVDCTVHLRATREAERELQVDEATLKRVLERVRDIASRAGGTAVSLDPIDVLRWPGVLQDSAPDNDALAAATRALFKDSVHELVAMRAREGERLRELVLQRCEALVGLIGSARAQLPELRDRAHHRLQARLAELGATVEATRFEQEVALLLQRADVDEELDRLDAHLAEIRRVLDGEEAGGRRLDFLMQELHREANTFSSKSQELDSTRLAVDMKVLIEQLREQVQNIE
ncbi:MAG: YicC family protein [Proteobacteria bacterium]|nr:YicC family protein [Pseudomonadota bacterium]